MLTFMSTPPHDCPTLLIVDDNLMARAVMSWYFEDQGFCVLQASDGAEAIDIATGGTLTAVLMDIRMPMMDGITATRHLRALFDKARLPILAFTGVPTDVDGDRELFNAILAKPMTPRDVHEVLKSSIRTKNAPALDSLKR